MSNCHLGHQDANYDWCPYCRHPPVPFHAAALAVTLAWLRDRGAKTGTPCRLPHPALTPKYL